VSRAMPLPFMSKIKKDKDKDKEHKNHKKEFNPFNFYCGLFLVLFCWLFLVNRLKWYFQKSFKIEMNVLISNANFRQALTFVAILNSLFSSATIYFKVGHL